MGHKTHPLGFRVGITQPAYSQWYTKLNNYSDLIKEDFLIRKHVLEFVQKMIKTTAEKTISDKTTSEKTTSDKTKQDISIGKVFIRRTNIAQKLKKQPLEYFIQVYIYTPTPKRFFEIAKIGEKGIEETYLKQLDEELEIIFKDANQPDRRLFLTKVVKIKNPYSIADYIAEQFVKELETRIPFRRAMKKIIEMVQSKNWEPIGIKIQVSGRLNGADIARTEWRRQGRVPLHTLRAEIDYSSKTAATIYGSFGVKIWLFKREHLPIN